MVRPDRDAGGRREEPREAAATGSLATAAVLAVAAGALLQAVSLERADGLARGALSPGAPWFVAAAAWLPALLIGAAAGAGLRPRAASARTARAIALLLLGAAAAAVARGAPGAALGAVAALATGLVGGVHVATLRRLGGLGALCAGGLAAAAALGVERCSSSTVGFAVGFAAAMLGLVLRPVACSGARAALRPLLRALCLLMLLGSAIAAAAAYAAPSAAGLAALVAIAGCAVAGGRPGLALGAAAGTLLGPLLMPSPAALGPQDRELARAGSAALAYVRSNQQLEVRIGGEVLAAAGPDRDEEPLLAALTHAFGRAGDVVMLLGRGAGRVAPSLRAPGRLVVEVADAWPTLAPLAARAAADGPVAPPGALDVSDPAESPARLSDRAPGSRQLVCVCELPIAATRHRATASFQRALRRIAGDGLVLQPLALDRVAPDLLQRLLRAARRAHPWSGLYRVGDAAVLVAGAARPVVQAAALSDRDVGWALHRAHLGGAADIEQAWAGELTDGCFAAGALGTAEAVLGRSLVRPDPSGSGDELLGWWSRRRADLQAAHAELLQLADDAAGRAAALQIGLRFVASGAPRPWLQAALGLADADGVSLRDPRLQSRCAHALDPTFFAALPPVFRSLPTPTAPLGDLEDECRVVVSDRLARRCSGDNPLAVALRARFPSRCARALVQALARGPLTTDEALALRELCDPFVLQEIARALLPAGRWRELLRFWNRELPLPRGLRAATAALDAPARREVARALRTHAHASCAPLLADLMTDGDREVCALAGAALRATLGDRIPFDPQWSKSRRLEAASRLLELHNRRP